MVIFRHAVIFRECGDIQGVREVVLVVIHDVHQSGRTFCHYISCTHYTHARIPVSCSVVFLFGRSRSWIPSSFASPDLRPARCANRPATDAGCAFFAPVLIDSAQRPPLNGVRGLSWLGRLPRLSYRTPTFRPNALYRESSASASSLAPD